MKLFLTKASIIIQSIEFSQKNFLNAMWIIIGSWMKALVFLITEKISIFSTFKILNNFCVSEEKMKPLVAIVSFSTVFHTLSNYKSTKERTSPRTGQRTREQFSSLPVDTNLIKLTIIKHRWNNWKFTCIQGHNVGAESYVIINFCFDIFIFCLDQFCLFFICGVTVNYVISFLYSGCL